MYGGRSSAFDIVFETGNGPHFGHAVPSNKPEKRLHLSK